MRLFKFIVLPLLGLMILTPSCNNKKTYADRLKDEKKAIDLFIAKNNLEILKKYPTDGKFKANEFFLDQNTGVYIHIIEHGDTTSPPKWKEPIYILFKGLHYFRGNDTVRYSNLASTYPEELEYVGPVSAATRNNYTNAGWAVPLSFVGHRGKVKLIIPFEMGSSYDQSMYEPTYYDQVEYRFDSKW